MGGPVVNWTDAEALDVAQVILILCIYVRADELGALDVSHFEIDLDTPGLKPLERVSVKPDVGDKFWINTRLWKQAKADAVKFMREHGNRAVINFWKYGIPIKVPFEHDENDPRNVRLPPLPPHLRLHNSPSTGVPASPSASKR